MSSVIVDNDRYTVDPLYQWDVNQVLEVRGLSLPSVPEIHFTNEAMDRSITRQATMNNAGIITVNIPNSLLQKPYTIKAHICIYEGDTFKTLYTISIPVKARKKPTDYTLENDEEIYSFNALENLVNNTVVNLKKAEDKYVEAQTKYNEAIDLLEESNTALETATNEADQAKKDYDEAKGFYNDASETLREINENYSDILSVIPNKAEKPTIIAGTLLASGWSNNTYSFENTYPVATYDIEIALNSTATAEQVEAFNSALIVGSVTSNIVTAFGDVPTVDIPIIIKAVAK